jgi:hypothetical protein
MADDTAYEMRDDGLPTGARECPEAPRLDAADAAIVERALAVLEQESRVWTDLQHRKHSRSLEPDLGSRP